MKALFAVLLVITDQMGRGFGVVNETEGPPCSLQSQ
jgi:hypothetical protein